MGMPACRPRSTFRTYFRDLKTSDPEGWLDKAKQFTGESEQKIISELRVKRTAKSKKAAPKRTQERKPEPGGAELPIRDLIDTMTTGEEAASFVRSSPTISQQFLAFVVNERKKKGKPTAKR